MTEKPFVHKEAFVDFKTNFIFHDDVASMINKTFTKHKGIINVGGISQSVYKFVSESKKKILKNHMQKKFCQKTLGLNPSMNINKLKKILSVNLVV